MPDLESLLSRLLRHDVRFVLVGGYAAAAHGCTLVTMDVDVCCDMSRGNLMNLQAALDAIHPVHRMTPRRLPLRLTHDKCRAIRNLYLDTDSGPLDCLGEIKGVGDYGAVFRMSEPIELPSGTCRILTLDALILAKSAMDRPRDRDAVLQLTAIRERSKGRRR